MHCVFIITSQVPRRNTSYTDENNNNICEHRALHSYPWAHFIVCFAFLCVPCSQCLLPPKQLPFSYKCIKFSWAELIPCGDPKKRRNKWCVAFYTGGSCHWCTLAWGFRYYNKMYVLLLLNILIIFGSTPMERLFRPLKDVAHRWDEECISWSMLATLACVNHLLQSKIKQTDPGQDTFLWCADQKIEWNQKNKNKKKPWREVREERRHLCIVIASPEGVSASYIWPQGPAGV